MSEEREIKDFTFYTSEMEKGMQDKLFFLKFLPKHKWYNFLDFGCANGKTLEAISIARNPKNERQWYDTFCGYDKSEEMIQLARSQWQGHSDYVQFVTDWDKRYETEKDTVLILSSVLHEIYSYCRPEGIEKFWKDIYEAKPNYIVIRDMCWSADMDREIFEPGINGERGLGFDDRDFHFISNFVKNSGVKKYQIDEFEDKWGTIYNVKNFLHLLLKYRYVVNWERELRENYFAVSDTELLRRIQTSEYNILYFERFQLPTIEKFTQVKFKENKINDNTHIKIILKRKES